MVETFVPVAPENTEQLDLVAAIWNSASGGALPISPELVRFNLRPARGHRAAAQLALDASERPIGCIVAAANRISPVQPATGHIDLIAVAPPFQRLGTGTQLLHWAETWLKEQDCGPIALGGSLRPFLPGIPLEPSSHDFFVKCGYTAKGEPPSVWDLARSLRSYVPPAGVDAIPCAVRPAQPGQTDELLSFLQREFPGRWHLECEQFLADGGRISDYMLLWNEDGLRGACRLTFEDSAWPIERFYPYQLPRPWGQLGSIGIAAAARGRGLGLALLDGGLRRLHNNGVNGCIIDWTDLHSFYAKAGFQPHRQYHRLAKEPVA